jgi:hypothetical protein
MIVDAHGWDVRVTESSGRDTRFEIAGVGFRRSGNAIVRIPSVQSVITVYSTVPDANSFLWLQFHVSLRMESPYNWARRADTV